MCEAAMGCKFPPSKWFRFSTVGQELVANNNNSNNSNNNSNNNGNNANTNNNNNNHFVIECTALNRYETYPTTGIIFINT